MATGNASEFDAAGKRRPKHRSPNYPLFDLEKAVEKTKILYKLDKTHKVPIGTVHERWGYKKLSAAGNQALAATKSYGLVVVEGEGDSRMVGVSDCGRRIVLDSPEREQLLKECAVGPSLFNSLWAKYQATGIPSDDVLRHHLVFDRKFNEDFVDSAIERFKATVGYAKLIAGDTIEDGGSDGDDGEEFSDEADSQSKETPKRTPPKGRQAMQPGTIEEVYDLDEGPAILQWPQQISQASAEDLEAWLKLIIGKAKRRAKMTDKEQTPAESG